MIRRWPLLSAEDLQQWVWKVAGEATLLEDKAIKARSASCREWKQQALAESGAPKILRFMRGPQRPPVFGTKHRAGGDIKTVADEKAQFWHNLWLATPGSESSPCRAAPPGYRFDLMMPIVMQARALLRTYPWTTAVGADA